MNTPIADIEAFLCRELRGEGLAYISAEALAEAICARCHEEVRVWAVNFARTHDALAEEGMTHLFFALKRRRASDHCPKPKKPPG